ncbi:MAG: sugar phosphate isomerase/epimerase [Planctomycetes bacterium]|nr:sugar phosphate isomerase/epimerase [Planctomycetota bacterium]
MQLGLVTYMWGAEWDLPTLIKNLEAAGILGVELRSGHKHGVEPSLNAQQRQEVAKRFADSPVDLVGLGSACEFHSPDPAIVKKNIEETKAFINLCHDVGGTGVKVRPNGLPEGVPVEKTLEQIGKALNEVAAYGEGYGVAIRLEVHGRGTSELPHIKRIMDVAQHRGATVCWNCNPADLEGQGLESNFRLVQDRLGTIHIHDLISDYPWPKLFELLKAAKFEGWTLIEEGKPTSDPIRVMQYYRRLWETMAG